MIATLKYRDVSNDAIKLMLFPYSLEGAARVWYEKEPPNSILTWEDLVNKFFNQFFPPSKTTHLKNKISRFTQRFKKTFSEAWDRFKELLRDCPHHGFSKLTQIDTFYNGLTEQDQDSLNAAAGGNLLNKTTREALKIIENKSKVRYSRNKSNVARVNTNSRDNANKTDDRIDKLADQISNLVEIVNKQVIAPAKAVEKTCVTCGATHAYYECIATDIPNNQIPPSVPNELSSYMKSNEIMIKSMQNQINVLKGDFNKQEKNLRKNLNDDMKNILSRFFQNQPSTLGTLPRNTIPNPKGEMKTVTTRNGLAYEGPSIPTESSLEKVDEQNTEEILNKEQSNSSRSTAQVQPSVVPIPIPEPDGDILFLEKLLNEDPFQLPPMDLKLVEKSKEKPSVEELPELELKELPSHLEYVFLEDSNKLPVIIAKNLTVDEKEALINVLKSHKWAIAWKISDIKGIDPRFCIHKILMKDDYKPAIQSQRRVNPKIHDVIKNEVIKLLNAGMIYPISDSPWVSPIYCVPKKRGMTVVANENNELIPTHLVTGWRVWIDYRKLNDATRKDHFPLPFMDQMLERLAGNEFYCFLDGFSREGIVLGHKISKSGIEVDRAKVDVIAKLPHPTTVKSKLTEASILVVPDWKLPFELMCDASDYAIGAVLGQRKSKHFQPIHYASKMMIKAQIHYTTTEKEMLVVVYAFEKFRQCLVLSKSIVYTDHSALKYLLNKQDAKPRLL
nr:reverse transcriptase domain-containing protein [Tanacetum cinerariifolium]